jgi:hypothetical protein
MARHVALMPAEILCSCTARHCTARSFRRLITTSGQLTGYAWQRSDEFRLYRQSGRRFSSNKVVSRLKPAGPVSGQLRPECCDNTCHRFWRAMHSQPHKARKPDLGTLNVGRRPIHDP